MLNFSFLQNCKITNLLLIRQIKIRYICIIFSLWLKLGENSSQSYLYRFISNIIIFIAIVFSTLDVVAEWLSQSSLYDSPRRKTHDYKTLKVLLDKRTFLDWYWSIMDCGQDNDFELNDYVNLVKALLTSSDYNKFSFHCKRLNNLKDLQDELFRIFS